MLASELMLMITWGLMLYSVIHFFFIQVISYKDRTTYQRIITWISIFIIVMIFLSVMFP
jgi:hypothetical protein